MTTEANNDNVVPLRGKRGERTPKDSPLEAKTWSAFVRQPEMYPALRGMQKQVYTRDGTRRVDLYVPGGIAFELDSDKWHEPVRDFYRRCEIMYKDGVFVTSVPGSIAWKFPEIALCYMNFAVEGIRRSWENVA